MPEEICGAEATLELGPHTDVLVTCGREPEHDGRHIVSVDLKRGSVIYTWE